MRIQRWSIGILCVLVMGCNTPTRPSQTERYVLSGSAQHLELGLRNGESRASWITIQGTRVLVAAHLCTSRVREGHVHDTNRVITIVQDGTDLGICE